MKHSRIRSRAPGFSLIEVLIALIIISVGLLGIAKLDTLVLSNTGTSRVRALVAMEADSLAASMHANRDYWASTPASYVIIKPTDATPIQTGDATLAAAIAANTPCEESSAGAGVASCTSHAAMAAADLSEWALGNSVTGTVGMSTILPGSTTNIACATANGVTTCTIDVKWQESTVYANKQEAQEAAAQQAANNTPAFQSEDYQLVVEP
jgi:type IV pilus assembly protein PilV